MNAAEETLKEARPAPGAAPGPGLLAAAGGALLLPLLLAALYPLLPEVLRIYLPVLRLPLLVVESALVFGLFLMPLFKCPGPQEAAPVLTGLARGLLLGLAALPFALAARIVAPVPIWGVLAGCLLVAVTGAGAAAGGAAFRTRGLAAAIVLTVPPALLGFLAADVCPRLAWLASISPFVAAGAALGGGGGWPLGLLPGIVLMGAGLASGRRGS